MYLLYSIDYIVHFMPSSLALCAESVITAHSCYSNATLTMLVQPIISAPTFICHTINY